MLNLIPVVMFLLMQGAGGTEVSLRQQQALLDLASRVHTAQSQGDLQTELGAQAGVDAAGLAYWIQVFSSVATLTQPAAIQSTVEGKADFTLQEERSKTELGWNKSDRTRDGPSAS